jgi:hypothetical protein
MCQNNSIAYIYAFSTMDPCAIGQSGMQLFRKPLKGSKRHDFWKKFNCGIILCIELWTQSVIGLKY